MRVNKKYKTSLFIFRRDLRIHDNQALAACIEQSESVIPIFIFNDHQVNPKKNDYFSETSFNFMLESLDDLRNQFSEQKGTLFFAKDDIESLIKHAHAKHNIESVFVASDYTPFSKKRDEHNEKICLQLGITFHGQNDIFLNHPDNIKTGSGTPYKVFTPFKNTSKRIPVEKEIPVNGESVWQEHSSFKTNYQGLVERTDKKAVDFSGGRSAGLSRMKHVKELKDYYDIRNHPSVDGTSKLSPHLKFGTLSVREVYWCIYKQFGPEHGLINELYWRDFYAHLTWHFPHVLRGYSFKEQYDAIEWENNQELFDAWCNGKTGYPIVDAGMRQLNETGWMHNRVRMIVASFLVKDLHVDWRWGEKYFARHLVDYDPMTNNGSWQWAASTGADAQPYFRIFNPWRQQEKFDADCSYIKQYVPELAELDAKLIHKLVETPLLVPVKYVRPIVDHKERAEQIKQVFKNI